MGRCIDKTFAGYGIQEDESLSNEMRHRVQREQDKKNHFCRWIVNWKREQNLSLPDTAGVCWAE